MKPNLQRSAFQTLQYLKKKKERFFLDCEETLFNLINTRKSQRYRNNQPANIFVCASRLQSKEQLPFVI